LKIALGLIVRNLNEKVNILYFLENAEKYNHKIDEVIIAYSETYSEGLVKKIEKHSKIKLLKINHCHELEYQLKEIGMNNEDIKILLFSEDYENGNLIPYGKNRNNVVIKAIMDEMDVLFFVDDDVKPSVITRNNGKIEEVEIDFFGEHLKKLKNDIYVTTSDYSGYYIVPPMKFDNMEYFVRGIQKGELFSKSWIEDYGYLTIDKMESKEIFRTNKVLGGNLALRLDIFKYILPFFSSVYTVRDEVYLTRGEDTLLGLEIDKIYNKYFLDIDVKIFHDTFNDFPKPPNILKESSVRDRFFYACMGWIGRNAFLNWILNRDLKDYYGRTRKALIIGTPSIAKYLDDSRFLLLPEALDESYKNLPKMIIEYYQLRNSWAKFIEKRYDEN
jgi:hypothetical protein